MKRTGPEAGSRASRPRPDRGLDLLNLLLAGSGSAYGAFIPVYLVSHSWNQTRIGMVLTVGTIVSMLCQVPAGMLVDAMGARRRRILAVAIFTSCITPLLFAWMPQKLPILIAMVLQAMAGSLLSPAIAALSLAVAGREHLGERLGRNSRYGSVGAGFGAVVMGACVYSGSQRLVFLVAALMIAPALWALFRIGPDRVEPVAADAAADAALGQKKSGLLAPLALLRDRRLLVFALCVALFQTASIAVLQLSAVEVTARLGSRSGVVIAAFLLVPQIMVAWLSPGIGRFAERYGRRSVLLFGFLTVPLRGVLFAVVKNPYALVPVQVLEGVGGGIFGVMMPLVAADLTRVTGNYTLCLSLFGLAAGLGGAVSTSMAGWVLDSFGRTAAFWALAAAGLLAAALVALAMPETRPPIVPEQGTDPR